MIALDQTLFVVCWEQSQSITEVVIALARAGHPEMDANRVIRMAWAMRKLGVNLKIIARPALVRQDAEISPETLVRYARDLVKTKIEGQPPRQSVPASHSGPS